MAVSNLTKISENKTLIKLVLIWFLVIAFPVIRRFIMVTSYESSGGAATAGWVLSATLVYLIMLAVYWLVCKGSLHKIGRYFLRAVGLVPLLMPVFYTATGDDGIAIGLSVITGFIGVVTGLFVALIAQSQLHFVDRLLAYLAQVAGLYALMALGVQIGWLGARQKITTGTVPDWVHLASPEYIYFTAMITLFLINLIIPGFRQWKSTLTSGV